MADLPFWTRPHFTEARGTAQFMYVAFIDQVPSNWAISASTYRCNGIPEGIDVMAYSPDTHAEVINGFREGPLWDQLVHTSSELAKIVSETSSCIALRGTVADKDTLDDHRNLVGLVQWLCDQGAGAILDLTAITWWSPSDWREKAFDPNAPAPHAHVIILDSENADGTHWLHTRGMIKYARPDISVRGVPEEKMTEAAQLINRFIEMMALGGLVPDNAAIRVDGLPEGMIAKHGGSLDDPDFNNVHLAIDWING